MERNQDKDKSPRNDDQKGFSNNTQSMFAGGYNTKYNPREVQSHMDYQTPQNGMVYQQKSTEMDSDLKNMLFQYLASQKWK